MKFKVGDVILRARRKEPRTVLAIDKNGYTLSDSKNGFGSIWWNTYIVETEFRLYNEHSS